ncbi:MAG: hypothetical protein AAF335_03275 [Bacteroidota bacterium]
MKNNIYATVLLMACVAMNSTSIAAAQALQTEETQNSSIEYDDVAVNAAAAAQPLQEVSDSKELLPSWIIECDDAAEEEKEDISDQLDESLEDNTAQVVEKKQEQWHACILGGSTCSRNATYTNFLRVFKEETNMFARIINHEQKDKRKTTTCCYAIDIEEGQVVVFRLSFCS